MGKWFADFFRNEGYIVHVKGRSTGMSFIDMASQCTVIIVSVPISDTCKVIEAIGPLMSKESLLMDLTSLKVDPVKTMLSHSEAEVIGCHPLFGPSIESISGQNIVMYRARLDHWTDWPFTLFQNRGAHVHEITPERHDKIMAIVQGLTHLNTITMGLIIKESGFAPKELEQFATPVFRTKIEFIKKIFEVNPRLYAEIIGLNPGIHAIIDLYEKQLGSVKKLIESKDIEGFVHLLSK